MSINKDRVRLLVDALRSGDYRQGTNMLRTLDDKYCCLGVACEVARLNGIGIEWGMVEPTCSCSDCSALRWQFAGSTESLRLDVAGWYGFPGETHVAEDPVIGKLEDNTPVTMIRANDDWRWTFDQIADAVEATFLTEEDPA